MMTTSTATLDLEIRPVAPAASADQPGMTTGAVRTWLRLEGLAALGLGLVLYALTDTDWLFLIPLLLLPDASALGYLISPRIGTFTYNVFHNWAPGFIALAIGAWLGSTEISLIAAILIAHVGMDRAVGYGLKLPTSFQDTHLGRMGRRKA
jgi:hypothetical protein